mgnify:CR=1 FL=1
MNAGEIHDALTAAGVRHVASVATTKGVVEVRWFDDATDDDRAAAAEVLRTLDTTPKPPRSVGDVLTGLRGLTERQLAALVSRMLAEAIAADPSLPGRAGVKV